MNEVIQDIKTVMEEKKYIYPAEKIKEWNTKMYGKNKNKKVVCELCKGTYTYYNKSHHNKCAKHERAVFFQRLIEEKNSFPQKYKKTIDQLIEDLDLKEIKEDLEDEEIKESLEDEDLEEEENIKFY